MLIGPVFADTQEEEFSSVIEHELDLLNFFQTFFYVPIVNKLQNLDKVRGVEPVVSLMTYYVGLDVLYRHNNP